MVQVHILDRCKYCDGQAYVYACEFVDNNGETSPRYIPGAYCKGSGSPVAEIGKVVRVQV